MENKKVSYFNPYLGGILLGLVLLTTFFITGRGLGASGANKSYIVTALSACAPEHVKSNKYMNEYVKKHDGMPIKEWLVFLYIGTLIGGFTSGAFANRIKLKIDKGPRSTNKTRIVFAVLGGMLFGIGSQFGRGCTSGAALTPMALLATSGFVSMMAIFGAGYLVAYFFRKLWI